MIRSNGVNSSWRICMAANKNNPYHTPSHWTLEQILEDRTDRSGGPDACWPWTRSSNRKGGYGRFKQNGKNLLAHRAAWLCINGSIPENLRVLHRCDNPPCCNPGHLFLGTQAENVADMHAKKRDRKRGSMGSANGMSKLTEDDVRNIRADGRPLRDISTDYGISYNYAGLIRRGNRRAYIGT